MEFSSHHFILTGATGGLGSALARSFKKTGCKLTLVGRDQQRLEELSSVLDYPYLTLDINTETGQQELVEYVALQQQQQAPVTGLINNAAVAGFGLLTELEQKQLYSVMITNLITPIRLTQRLLPYLATAKKGLVVNIGSTFGDIGYPANSIYCASKFGLRGFTQSLRRELSNTNVDAVYIAPRAIRTAMNNGLVQRINQKLKVSEDQPEWVADGIVQSLMQGRHSLYFGWMEKCMIKINHLFPKMIDRGLQQHLKVIKQEIKHDESIS